MAQKVDASSKPAPALEAGVHMRRQIRSTLSVLLTVLALGALCWLGFQLRMVLLLVFASVLFSYVLAPLVVLIEKRGIERRRAVLVVYGSLSALIAGVSVAVVPRGLDQLKDFVTHAPDFAETLRLRVDAANSFLGSYAATPALRDAIEHGRLLLIDALEVNLAAVMVGALATLKVVPWLALIPIVAFFFLRESSLFRRSFLGLLPKGRVRWRGEEYVEELIGQLALYVRAQLLACLFIGVCCTIGFYCLGLKYAILLGLIACVFEFIPVVGPLSVAALSGLLASFQEPSHLGVTLGFLLVLRLVHDQFVYPALISHNTKLRPLAIMFALICGSQLGGIAGMFLAIPMTVVGIVSYRYLKMQLGSEGLVAELLHSEEPADVPAIDPLTVKTPTPKKLNSVRIVIVDNEADARDVLAIALQGAGATVWGAASAAQAIELVRQHLPDLVICDIGMPDGDGFEFIHHLRALDPKQGGLTPAAALTGYTTREDHERAKAAGFQLHLAQADRSQRPDRCGRRARAQLDVQGRGGAFDAAREHRFDLKRREYRLTRRAGASRPQRPRGHSAPRGRQTSSWRRARPSPTAPLAAARARERAASSPLLHECRGSRRCRSRSTRPPCEA